MKPYRFYWVRLNGQKQWVIAYYTSEGFELTRDMKVYSKDAFEQINEKVVYR